MSMAAMILARLTARFLGRGRRLILFAKRRGLTLAFAMQLFDQPQQLINATLKLLDLLLSATQLLLEFGVLLTELNAGRADRFAGTGLIARRVHTRYTTRITLAVQ
jgi:hypothetical protein